MARQAKTSKNNAERKIPLDQIAGLKERLQKIEGDIEELKRQAKQRMGASPDSFL